MSERVGIRTTPYERVHNVNSESIAGETIAELQSELPDDVHIALITRDHENRLPHPNDRIERGDHLTFIGRREAVREAL